MMCTVENCWTPWPDPTFVISNIPSDLRNGLCNLASMNINRLNRCATNVFANVFRLKRYSIFSRNLSTINLLLNIQTYSRTVFPTYSQMYIFSNTELSTLYVKNRSQFWEVPLLSRDALIEPFPYFPFWAKGWCLGADLCWGMGDE